MRIGKIILGFAALAVTTLWLHDAAQAQLAGAGAGADSRSGAVAGSTSGSAARADGSSRASGTASASNGAQAGGGTAGLTFNQGNNSPSTVNNPASPSDVIVRSAPTVYVPNIVTGNVCALGASGGASWLGAGLAAGVSWESMSCERRQTAALLWNMGTPDSRAAAKEVVCVTPEVRAAFARSGSPCIGDGQTVQAQPVQQQQLAPMSVAPAPAGREVCLNRQGREVPAGTPGSSCGFVGS